MYALYGFCSQNKLICIRSRGRHTYTVVAVLRVAAGVTAAVFPPRLPNIPVDGAAVEPPLAVVAFGVAKPMVAPI